MLKKNVLCISRLLQAKLIDYSKFVNKGAEMKEYKFS